MARIPVIMDVDTGVDDAAAIMLAASSPEIELLALTSVYGNRPVNETFRNTRRLASLLGLGVPVAAGAAKPLLDPPIDYSAAPVIDIHGADGLGNIGDRIPDPDVPVCSLTAAELMADKIASCDRKVTIIATGPLTNIAVFLLGYPQLHGRIERILFMGGAAHGGNLKPSAEANAGHDPEAAEVVLTSGLDIYMFGLDATMGCFITDDERAAMRDCGRTGAFIADCLQQYAGIYQSVAGLPGAVLHDSLPVAWLLDSSVAELRDYNVRMDLNGSRTRGCTVTDTADVSKLPANAHVAVSADRDRFIGMHLAAARRFD